jgi:polysaccharide pyruvyl transferase WcaK-like protein
MYFILGSFHIFHKLLLPHNIDVVHNEKNIGEAIWNTCFDIAKKRKDNVKARLDLTIICNRPSMHLVKKSNGQWDRPRGPFSVHKDVKPTILQWFKEL